ncbi:SDR family NAD(P)-dependent oxidoreductase [Paraburkholderia sediminicola]|uniref:SDR family NAD(P)-dependent oxidoreductase n=1 Tax=Paraburkholderia sediminicola TaxID=458836 RepID=UPI0038BB31DA
MTLDNKIALVTGAARGLGKSIALAYTRAGAQVIICDVNEENLNAAREEVTAAGPHECIAQVCDVSSSAQVAQLFASIAARFGRLDVLVNNAGIGPIGPEDDARRNRHWDYMTTPVPRQALGFTSSMSDEQWHRYWGVNVHGVFYCTREALRIMEPQGSGKIINIASIAGMSTISAHSPHYSATKGAVITFTRTVAAEVAGGNIYVNAIAPGGIQTPDFEKYFARSTEEQKNRLMQLIPLGRFGKMEEYASLAVYLASDNHYLVGQIISPNGGAV